MLCDLLAFRYIIFMFSSTVEMGKFNVGEDGDKTLLTPLNLTLSLEFVHRYLWSRRNSLVPNELVIYFFSAPYALQSFEVFFFFFIVSILIIWFKASSYTLERRRSNLVSFMLSSIDNLLDENIDCGGFMVGLLKHWKVFFSFRHINCFKHFCVIKLECCT